MWAWRRGLERECWRLVGGGCLSVAGEGGRGGEGGGDLLSLSSDDVMVSGRGAWEGGESIQHAYEV